jgi:ephrin-B
MIVIELMRNGDLHNHLKSIKPRSNNGDDSAKLPSQLLDYCKQVANGMSYLSKKSFVHRDLAARNIFLDDNYNCKVGDFGMSRDLEDENYYVSQGGKIPVKWTAPEALQYKKYAPPSDVFSYGALLYEIWSLGHKPFEGFSNPQTVDMVQSGYRLPPPPGCPRGVYQMMIHCWHPDSSRRPTFDQILDEISTNSRVILSWRDVDKRVHPQASVLGTPLEAGQDLYPELQQTFVKYTIKH